MLKLTVKNSVTPQNKRSVWNILVKIMESTVNLVNSLYVYICDGIKIM